MFQVIRMEIASASAKVRTGPPSDDRADMEHAKWGNTWAGVVPMRTVYDGQRRVLSVAVESDAFVDSAPHRSGCASWCFSPCCCGGSANTPVTPAARLITTGK